MDTEWLNKNRYRKYPFNEDCVFQIYNTQTEERYSIPNWLIVDLFVVDFTDEVFSTQATTNVEHVYLSGVDITESDVVLNFNYREKSFSISISKSTVEEERFSFVTGSVQGSGYNDKSLTFRAITGFGDLEELPPVGSYEFYSRPKLLTTKTLRVKSGLGVTSINGTELSGDIYVCSGKNTSFHVVNGNLVLSSDKLSKGDDEEEQKSLGCFSWFNGFHPDFYTGDIWIYTDFGIDIQPDGAPSTLNPDVPRILIKASPSLKYIVNELRGNS